MSIDFTPAELRAIKEGLNFLWDGINRGGTPDETAYEKVEAALASPASTSQKDRD